MRNQRNSAKSRIQKQKSEQQLVLSAIFSEGFSIINIKIKIHILSLFLGAAIHRYIYEILWSAIFIAHTAIHHASNKQW